jgi:hypothetical protein
VYNQTLQQSEYKKHLAKIWVLHQGVRGEDPKIARIIEKKLFKIVVEV